METDEATTLLGARMTKIHNELEPQEIWRREVLALLDKSRKASNKHIKLIKAQQEIMGKVFHFCRSVIVAFNNTTDPHAATLGPDLLAQMQKSFSAELYNLIPYRPYESSTDADQRQLCTAKTRSGTNCPHYALPGYVVCQGHGAGSPTARRKIPS